jgi:hypothetical protein
LGALTDFVVDMDKEQIVGVQVGHSTADGMANEVFALPGVQLGDGSSSFARVTRRWREKRRPRNRSRR